MRPGCKLPHLQEYHNLTLPDSENAGSKGAIEDSRTLQKRRHKVRPCGLGTGAEAAQHPTAASADRARQQRAQLAQLRLQTMNLIQ